MNPELSNNSLSISLLVPFIVLAVVLLLYYVIAKGAPGKQQAMKNDINFYLVCILATSIVSIVASVRLGKDWFDTGVWLVGGVAIVAAVWKFRGSESSNVNESKQQGPLEQNDSRRP